MKKYLVIATFVFINFTFILGQESPAIIVNDDFDRGSIGKLEEVSSGYLKGKTAHWIYKEKNDDQYYWFCFSLENVKDRLITVELNNLVGKYKGKTQEMYSTNIHPVYSYDKVNWSRIEDVSYNNQEKTFIFKKAFSKNIVWIAYAHPYFYTRLTNLIALIEEDENVDVDYFGRSSRENSLPKITITNHNVNKEKQVIFIQAMQNSGEDAGGYVVEGIIRYLLSADSLANKILNNLEFVFAPMLNPDGFYMGTSNYSSLMGDLNTQWFVDNSNNVVEPEVRTTEKLLEQLNTKKGIDLFIDIHCNANTKNEIISSNESVKYLSNSINKYHKIESSTTMFDNSASSYVLKKYNIPACTMELSQTYINDTKSYLTIYDYFRYGEDLSKAIYEYFLLTNNK